MTNQKIRLHLVLLDQYLSNHGTYDYTIQSMITLDEGICFSITEYTPTHKAEPPYILLLKITSSKNLSVRNSDGKDCIYDYLTEAGIDKEDADMESAIYRKIIEKFLNE